MRGAARGVAVAWPARVAVAAVAAVVVLGSAACGGGDRLEGRIQIDGSSTVYPVSQAMAEEFMRSEGRGVRVTVAFSGTGGGFKRFCAGETEISNASRPITAAERQACERSGVEPVELEIARDGLSVVANPADAFLECLTVAELRRIWEPGSSVRRWSDVRDGFPDLQVRLYGPGTDSGTFDYFTEAVMGESGASRSDYTASEDDNILVQGVIGDRGSLGYFGFAYYEHNRDRLKAVAVDGGSGCVRPSRETVAAGEYTPLSRPVYIYVAGSALERPEVQRFLEFYMTEADALIPEAGYIPLSAGEYRTNLSRVRERAGTG